MESPEIIALIAPTESQSSIMDEVKALVERWKRIRRAQLLVAVGWIVVMAGTVIAVKWIVFPDTPFLLGTAVFVGGAGVVWIILDVTVAPAMDKVFEVKIEQIRVSLQYLIGDRPDVWLIICLVDKELAGYVQVLVPDLPFIETQFTTESDEGLDLHIHRPSVN